MPKLHVRHIFDFRNLERNTGCILHVIYIAGTRMKKSGIDGLSRGNLMEGILRGENPLKFIPLNNDAMERLGGRMSDWVKS